MGKKQEPSGFPDALVVDGVDQGFEHRRRVREANRARQEADALNEAPIGDINNLGEGIVYEELGRIEHDGPLPHDRGAETQMTFERALHRHIRAAGE